MCFKHDSDDSTNPASVSNSLQHHKEHPSNTARTTTVCGRQCYNREKKALFDFSLSRSLKNPNNSALNCLYRTLSH
jgi:hypothetical protein